MHGQFSVEKKRTFPHKSERILKMKMKMKTINQSIICFGYRHVNVWIWKKKKMEKKYRSIFIIIAKPNNVRLSIMLCTMYMGILFQKTFGSDSISYWTKKESPCNRKTIIRIWEIDFFISSFQCLALLLSHSLPLDRRI